MKGRKTGGRQKGSLNKANADLRALAQSFTVEALMWLVKSMRAGGDDAVAAAKTILAYGHGLPRAAVDVSVKPIYVLSGEPLTAEQWAAKYADAPAGNDGNSSGSPVEREPVAKPAKSRAGVGATGRPAKRSR